MIRSCPMQLRLRLMSEWVARHMQLWTVGLDADGMPEVTHLTSLGCGHNTTVNCVRFSPTGAPQHSTLPWLCTRSLCRYGSAHCLVCRRKSRYLRRLQASSLHLGPIRARCCCGESATTPCAGTRRCGSAASAGANHPCLAHPAAPFTLSRTDSTYQSYMQPATCSSGTVQGPCRRRAGYRVGAGRHRVGHLQHRPAHVLVVGRRRVARGAPARPPALRAGRRLGPRRAVSGHTVVRSHLQARAVLSACCPTPCTSPME